MMQRLLIIFTCFVTISLSAQDTLWTEDFSRGFAEWSVNATACGNNTGPKLGTWALTSASVAGIPVPLTGFDVSFSFVNQNEYFVRFDSPLSYGTAYSLYTFAGDTLRSRINAAALSADTTVQGVQGNGIVNWAVNLSVDPVLLPVALTLIGAGDVLVTFNGGNMTITDLTGQISLVFARELDCGSSWLWSPNGNFGYGVLGLAPGQRIESATRDNGVAVINSLYLNSLGDVAYNPGSPPYPPHLAELISPEIDISDADRALEIVFTQAVRLLNRTTGAPPINANPNSGVRTSISVSTDGGLTWSLAIDANPTLGNNTTRRSQVILPLPSGYIGDAESIRVKFTYATDFWVWLVDDIVIRERTAYDIQANANFYAIAPNAVTPISQVTDLVFLADIQNNGGVTAEDVALTVEVKNNANEVIFTATKQYGDIVPDSLAENAVFEDRMPAELLDETGAYTGTYVLTHAAPDDRPANDTLRFSFIVSDTLFAKETGSTRTVSPAADNSYYFGNSFYVPNGSGYFARYISFGVGDVSPVVAVNGSVTTLFYEWEGDVNDDSQANPEEYNLLVFNNYLFQAGDNNSLITIPLDSEGQGVPLQDGKHYIALIQYVATGTEIFPMLASQTYDYGGVIFATDSLGVPQYGPILEVGEASEASFSTVGFGRGIIPVVRISIGNNPDLSGSPIVDVNDPLPATASMKVYPNPASERINLQIDLTETADWAEVRFFDATGRLIHRQRYEGLREGRFDYDVSQLANGSYFLQLVTEQGSRTEQVVVSH